ncbi:MAG: exodeoxyribonuclease VII small subunit [Alphaproteobacteria bacterium]|nr:exodeoxyribonuclease VII small subunit [Alphaproteobacteria bacterium]
MAKAADSKKDSDKDSDIDRMSFEDALEELEEIVRELEEGSIKLDQAITAYERGAKLKAHCEKKLTEAKTKVEKISLGPAGPEGTEPAEIG